MDYVVAIPSYRRPDIIAACTLQLLADRGVPADAVHIFLSDRRELQTYADRIDRDLYGALHVGAPGPGGNRNAIARHFPAGAAVCQFDDDITDLRIKVDDKTTEPVYNIDGFIRRAFDETLAAGLSMWGVYPTLNPYWMADRPSTGLKFLVGCVCGVINRPAEQLLLDEKEDYERTLLRWESDGAVVRFDNVACKQKTYKTPGGCQDSHDRVAGSARSAGYLLARWPNQVSLNTRRKGPHTEVLLRDRSR